jgi:hypothetical protein
MLTDRGIRDDPLPRGPAPDPPPRISRPAGYCYVNFLMDEGQERVRQDTGPAKYQRLKALKRKYDPHNFFRLNQNISPG